MTLWLLLLPPDMFLFSHLFPHLQCNQPTAQDPCLLTRPESPLQSRSRSQSGHLEQLTLCLNFFLPSDPPHIDTTETNASGPPLLSQKPRKSSPQLVLLSTSDTLSLLYFLIHRHLAIPPTNMTGQSAPSSPPSPGTAFVTAIHRFRRLPSWPHIPLIVGKRLLTRHASMPHPLIALLGPRHCIDLCPIHARLALMPFVLVLGLSSIRVVSARHPSPVEMCSNYNGNSLFGAVGFVFFAFFDNFLHFISETITT